MGREFAALCNGCSQKIPDGGFGFHNMVMSFGSGES